ncbi:hypothetical protein OAF83_02705 [Rubripirellula sp.]|nr:hypothetical protein [Rubripirellula sp.]MDB4749796.1 hypothetical protein [Rubripirellula sp.]
MRRILKIGGSMLLRDNLATAVNGWLDRHPADQTMVIVGGGKLIDAVRELDRQQPMNPQQVHWMCVDLLTITAKFAALCLACPLIATEADWNTACQERAETGNWPSPHWPVTNRPTVIAPAVFYSKRTSIPAIKLPDDWRTTTDSIAGLLAHIADADELVLLKSCPIAPAMSYAQLAEAGIVDQAFPKVSTTLPSVRVEQLR